MKYSMQSLRTIYKKLNKNTNVAKFKESILYNLIKAMFIVFFMILILFQIKPRKAYIYAELEQIDWSSLRCQASVLEVSDISSDNTSIFSMDKTVIDLMGLSINDTDYSDGDYLVLYSENNTPYSIFFKGSIIRASYYDCSLTDTLQYQNINSNSCIYRFSGEQQLSIYGAKAYIINANNGSKREFDISQTLVVMSNEAKQVLNECEQYIRDITECDGTISNEHIDEYQIYTNMIDGYRNATEFSIRISSEPANSEHKLAHRILSSVDFNSISTPFTISSKIICDGELTISYTPTAQEYALKKQELYLHSKDSSLNISYNIKDKTASISGYIDAATISKMSLFPNLGNWYYSNIYMAPLTLVSTVFAAVSMMNNSKKKHECG